MPWEPGRPAPSPPPMPDDRPLWVLVKAARSVRAVTRSHPLGVELRLLVGGEFLWSQVFRPTDRPTLTEVAELHRRDFLDRGWIVAS
ncbi:MAG: hypothetical protein AB7I13_00725 [Vicinamibacterales bacterium]